MYKKLKGMCFTHILFCPFVSLQSCFFPAICLFSLCLCSSVLLDYYASFVPFDSSTNRDTCISSSRMDATEQIYSRFLALVIPT